LAAARAGVGVEGVGRVVVGVELVVVEEGVGSVVEEQGVIWE
jgi:hypothetical protein